MHRSTRDPRGPDATYHSGEDRDLSMWRDPEDRRPGRRSAAVAAELVALALCAAVGALIALGLLWPVRMP